MLIRLIVFLALNFAALGIGSFLMANGPSTEWYIGLNKAPWTPLGWVFGAAWTTIMICFTIYMASAWNLIENRKLLLSLFTIQWLLNVLWNPVFFKYHQSMLSLVIIVGLSFVVGYILLKYLSQLRYLSLLILPYFIWLIIAASLNVYIYIKN